MVKLIRSNLHKDRAVMIVFMLIIMIASMLMHTSLLINTYDEVYDSKAEKQDIPDAIEQVRTDDDISGIINGCDKISQYSVTDMINILALPVIKGYDTACGNSVHGQ